MLEGLHPQNPTHVMRLTTDERTARRVADLIVETFDPSETASAAFENEATLAWEVEVYFARQPDEQAMRGLVEVAAGKEVAAAVYFEILAEKDWVKASLDGLSMVEAGRFVIHGSHDRSRVPLNSIGIEIEAALAFGTGHHGTTRGCLLMLDHILKQRRPVHVLDVGTGTGVLAIATSNTKARKNQPINWSTRQLLSACEPSSISEQTYPLWTLSKRSPIAFRRCSTPWECIPMKR